LTIAENELALLKMDGNVKPRMLISLKLTIGSNLLTFT